MDLTWDLTLLSNIRENRGVEELHTRKMEFVWSHNGERAMMGPCMPPQLWESHWAWGGRSRPWSVGEAGRAAPWLCRLWAVSPWESRIKKQTGTCQEQLSTPVNVPASTCPFTCLPDSAVNFLGQMEDSESQTVLYKKQKALRSP